MEADLERLLICCGKAILSAPGLTCGLCVQGVGKSCLVLRYVRGQFDESSKVTVGAAFMSHSVQVQDGTVVKFEIWCAVRRASALMSLHTTRSHRGPLRWTLQEVPLQRSVAALACLYVCRKVVKSSVLQL